MDTKEMSNLTIGDETYEVVDAKAREMLNSMSKATARNETVTLPASKWVDTGKGVRFTQAVDIKGLTENSEITFKMTGEQLEYFYDINATITADNINGVAVVSFVGSKPTEDFTLQAKITEVEK